MPRPDDGDKPDRIEVRLVGGPLDGQVAGFSAPAGRSGEAWDALRGRGLPLALRPDGGVRLAPDGAGYYPADRADAEGRPVLEWMPAKEHADPKGAPADGDPHDPRP